MAEGSENENRDRDTGAMQLADSSGNYTAARAASASQQIALNGGVAVTGSGAKPYPDMPKVSSTRPMLRSLGATGTAIFNGVVTSEEYNEDFYWKDAIRIYETMLRNDAQVNAVRELCELPIRRATWSMEPASDDPVDIEIASFVESCLFHEMRYVTSTGRTLTQKWDDTLRHILLMLWYGFSTFEQVWRIEDGWVKWARWLPLLPRTVWRWWVGEDNELVGIQQWTFKQYNYQFINIPAEKLLLFVHRQEGQNYEGLSLLRTAYKHWWYKDNFYKIEAIDIERNAIPTPVIHLPENFTDQDVTNATSMLANIRANESMGLTLPPGWSAEYLNAHGSSRGGPGSQMTPSIEHHDLMIARNVLGQFMNLGSDATGSYALASTQVDMFLNALQATCEYIEDVINLDAIPRLVDYNYDGVSVYPKLKASKLALQDIQGIATMLKDLAGQQPLITPGPELEDWIRSELGVPTAPASPVESENPSDESDLGNGEDEESSTVQGKAAPESPENTEDAEGVAGGDAADAGAEMSAGGGLTAESRLLREALDAAYGRWDAVERAMVFAGGGGGHEAGYSQNRDAHGRWAPGDGGEGGDRSSSGAGGAGGAGGAEGNARGGAKGSSSASPKGGSRGSRGGGGARVSVREYEYRGQRGYSISGRDAQGRQVKIFTPSREEAERIRGDIKAGREVTFGAKSKSEESAASHETETSQQRRDREDAEYRAARARMTPEELHREMVGRLQERLAYEEQHGRGQRPSAEAMRREIGRYQRGDVSAPRASRAPKNETGPQRAYRTAVDAQRHEIWLNHGPGVTLTGAALKRAADRRSEALHRAIAAQQALSQEGDA